MLGRRINLQSELGFDMKSRGTGPLCLLQQPLASEENLEVWFIFPCNPRANPDFCYSRLGLKSHYFIPCKSEGWVQTLPHFYKNCKTRFLLKWINEILCELATETEKYLPMSLGSLAVSAKGNVSLKEGQEHWGTERDFKLQIKTASPTLLAV